MLTLSELASLPSLELSLPLSPLQKKAKRGRKKKMLVT